jgi:hypothetical protein
MKAHPSYVVFAGLLMADGVGSRQQGIISKPSNLIRATGNSHTELPKHCIRELAPSEDPS